MTSLIKQAWTNLPLRIKGGVLVILPVLALIAAVAALHWIARQQEAAEAALQEAHILRSEVQGLHGLLAEAEAGIRGFALTGKPEYLEPYRAARKSALDTFTRLTKLASSGAQVEILHNLAALTERTFEDIEGVTLCPGSGRARTACLEEYIQRSESGRRSFNYQLATMRAAEEKVLAARVAVRNRLSWITGLAGIAAPLLAVLGGLLAMQLFTSGVGARIRVLEEKARRLDQRMPLGPPLGGSDEIGRLGSALEQAARSITESEEAFRRLFEEAPVAYHEIDRDGVVRRVNQTECRLLGLDAAQVLGQPVWNLIAPQQRETSRKAVLAKLAGRQALAPFHREYSGPNGSAVIMEVQENLLRDAAGDPVGIRSALMDITTRVRLEEELRSKNEELEIQNRRVQEASRLKSEFLANMSHELRTPLNGIIGFAELMLDEAVGPASDEQKEFLGDILTCARHLLKLINEVLDLAKVEAGKMEFRPEPCAPGKLASEVVDILTTLAAKKSIRLETWIERDLGEIVIDPSKFKQVLYNYISNALKFTPDRGRVTVRIQPAGDKDFRLEVEDTGDGIRPEDMGRLFVEFQQLDSTAGKKHQGTGLGLALTKRIVEAMGGRVGVHSTVGQGTLFYAVLPRMAAAPQEPKENAAPVVAVPCSAGPMVLVIDDDPQDRSHLARLLAGAGYGVDTAATGKEALAKCGNRQFDAITLDLLLPDTSGWELLRTIRADEKHAKVPVIVATLVAHEGAGIGFAIENLLTKPVKADDLLGSLKAAGIAPGGGRKVLVIDDDPSSLRLMETSLGRLGYDAVCMADSAAALRAAVQEPPAAVVVDLLMPGMDGLEFLLRFRQDEACRRVPVIVWTQKDLTSLDWEQLRALSQQVVLKSQGGIGSLLAELQTYVPLEQAKPPADGCSNGR